MRNNILHFHVELDQKAAMKSIFADSVGSLIAQPLNSHFHLAESPPCELNFVSALIRFKWRRPNYSDYGGNFFFFSRSSSTCFDHPRDFREWERSAIVSLSCLGKSRLFEVSWKVELGGSSRRGREETACFLGCREQRGSLFAIAWNETENKLETFSESDCPRAVRGRKLDKLRVSRPVFLLLRQRSARTGARIVLDIRLQL